MPVPFAHTAWLYLFIILQDPRGDDLFADDAPQIMPIAIVSAPITDHEEYPKMFVK